MKTGRTSRIQFLGALFSAFGMMACEKEIDVDLNGSDPKIVIEGIVREDSANQYVRVTKTVNFSDASAYPAVSNATVTLSDDAGNSRQLVETEPGLYKAGNYDGVPGRTYFLSVVAEGKTFTSQSRMPVKIPLDSVDLEPQEFGPPGAGNDGLIAFPRFKDLEQKGNAWWFVMETQRKKDLSINVANDNIGNGTEYERPVFSQDFEIKKGDTLRFEMRNIDPGTYTYFFSLNQNSGNGNGPGGGATPANPVSNIAGGCLGYFSAFTVQRLIVVAE